MRLLSPFLSVLLTPFIALNPIWAQSPTASYISDAPPLHVAVIRDSGVAKPNSLASQGFIVKVTDNSGTGVEDVAVALRLPDQSDSGTFPDGSRSAVAYTDANGEAQFEAIHWGDLIGPVDLKISAAKGSVHAGLLVTQAVAGVVAAQPNATSEPAPPPAPQLVVQPPQPGKLSTPMADAVPVPVSHSGATTTKPTEEPTVSIVNSRTGAGGHTSRKAILLVAVIGAGAGLGALMALNGHGSGSSSSAPVGISIGPPTISVGH